MEKITIEGSVYKTSYGTYDFAKMTKKQIDECDYGWLFVMPYSFEFELPAEFDERTAKIRALSNAEKRLRKEFNAKIERIKTEISKLESIGYEPGQHSETVSTIINNDDIPF